jgi:hypothetical protein
MASSIHCNNKFSTSGLSESKSPIDEHGNKPNYMPIEKNISSDEQQVIVKKSKYDCCPQCRSTTKKKEDEAAATKKLDRMFRWKTEGRVDAPWCLVNIVDKEYMHKSVELGKGRMEDQWSLDGEHGSTCNEDKLSYAHS